MAGSAFDTPFTDKAARFGWRRAFAAAVLQRLEQHLGVHVWAIFERPAQAAFELTPEQARFEFRKLGEAECLAATADPELALERAITEAALARGDECFGVFDQGRLIAYLWRSSDTAPLFGDLWIKLQQPGLFYGYKSLVRPEYRGQRLFQAMRGRFDAEYLERGLSRSVGYVALRNLPSLASLELDPGHARAGLAVIFTRGWRGWFLTGTAGRLVRFERRTDVEASIPDAAV